MNERGTECLKQYDLQIFNTQKTRGAILCETNQGRKLLKEYRGTIKRLEFEYQVLSRVREKGFFYVDNYVHNIEGELLTRESDYERYVLKDWFEGRECNVKDDREVIRGIDALARLHKILKQIPMDEEWNMGSIFVPAFADECRKHNKELKRARNYIRTKKRKSEFELRVLSSFQHFFSQAEEALEGVEKLIENEASLKERCLCHGEYSHHHVLLGEGYEGVIDFSKMHLNIQICDLYYFMRKIMEKNHWDVSLAHGMLMAYNRRNPISDAQMEYLRFLFLYPEKYWKQVNFYYNASKAWIPARQLEKLKNLEYQQKEKQNFLNNIW